MNAAYDQLLEYVEQLELNYITNVPNRSVWVFFSGEVGLYPLLAAVDEDEELFQVYARCPVTIPAGARPSVSEAIARANFGLRIGNFDLDHDDGELRFHISHLLTAGVLKHELFLRSYLLAIKMLDWYLPAILSVVYGNEHPKDAIRYVEAPACDCPEPGPGAEGESD